jgi:hypothetical protein
VTSGATSSPDGVKSNRAKAYACALPRVTIAVVPGVTMMSELN